MDNDELVPTSDPEELEELKAASPSYWTKSHGNNTIASRIPGMDVGGRPERAGEHAEALEVGASLRSTGAQRVPGSPWKRRKVTSPIYFSVCFLP